MIIRELIIKNFRSIEDCSIEFDKHNLVCGANNIGKSTLLEAINLVLGPDRIFSPDAINEFDFYKYQYLTEENEPIKIYIEVRLAHLSENEQRQFLNLEVLEYWDIENDKYISSEEVSGNFDETSHKVDCLRVAFEGYYDHGEDEFITKTYFLNSDPENPEFLNRHQKRDIGFLYLRYLRTGNRALSLERGSLLDIILQLKEIKYTSWKEVIDKIKGVGDDIRADENFDQVLQSIEDKVKAYTPLNSVTDKSFKFEVTNLTRRDLKYNINLFISTEPSNFEVPFRNVGNGTINVLMYSLLSIIADLKKAAGKSVIFGMEEPEIAIPPHTQRRVVGDIKKNSDQTIVTSHSPYVTEMFIDDRISVLSLDNGNIKSKSPDFEPFRDKHIKQNFRYLFAEGLLAKGIVAVEGISDKYALYAVSQLLSEFDPSYDHIDLVGLVLIDSKGATNISKYGQCFKSAGKTTMTLFDHGELDNVDTTLFNLHREHSFGGIEDLLTQEIPETVMTTFYDSDDCPAAQDERRPVPEKVNNVLKRNKGTDLIAQLIYQCENIGQLPNTLVTFLRDINNALS